MFFKEGRAMKPVCTAWYKINYNWFDGDIIDELRTFGKDIKRGYLVKCGYYRQFIGKPLMAYYEQTMLNLILYRYNMLKANNAEMLLYDHREDRAFFDDDKNTAILCDMVGMTNEELETYTKRNGAMPLSKGSCQWYRTKDGDIIIVCWSWKNIDSDFLNLCDAFQFKLNPLPKTYMGYFYEVTIQSSKIKNYGGVITEK
jgi:hypothetical protein